jgi:hypothetical protein
MKAKLPTREEWEMGFNAEKLAAISARQIRKACVLGLLLGSIMIIGLCLVIDRFQLNVTF